MENASFNVLCYPESGKLVWLRLQTDTNNDSWKSKEEIDIIWRVKLSARIMLKFDSKCNIDSSEGSLVDQKGNFLLP